MQHNVVVQDTAPQRIPLRATHVTRIQSLQYPDEASGVVTESRVTTSLETSNDDLDREQMDRVMFPEVDSNRSRVQLLSTPPAEVAPQLCESEIAALVNEDSLDSQWNADVDNIVVQIEAVLDDFDELMATNPTNRSARAGVALRVVNLLHGRDDTSCAAVGAVWALLRTLVHHPGYTERSKLVIHVAVSSGIPSVLGTLSALVAAGALDSVGGVLLDAIATNPCRVKCHRVTLMHLHRIFSRVTNGFSVRQALNSSTLPLVSVAGALGMLVRTLPVRIRCSMFSSAQCVSKP